MLFSNFFKHWYNFPAPSMLSLHLGHYKLKFLLFKVSFKEDKMYLKEVLTKWKFEISSLKIYNTHKQKML